MHNFALFSIHILLNTYVYHDSQIFYNPSGYREAVFSCLCNVANISNIRLGNIININGRPTSVNHSKSKNQLDFHPQHYLN